MVIYDESGFSSGAGVPDAADAADVAGICNHRKVYANYMLTCFPPIHPWICSLCGEEGRDRGDQLQGPTYDELRRKKSLSGTGA